MTDKLTLGVILGALIIASSVMAHVGLGPKLFNIPVIGGFGFFIAGIAGLWIIIDILRSRRK
jgi:ubiquinone biosynthesis protein